MPTDFKNFIQIIGRGHRSGKTLTFVQAKEAMQQILANQPTPEQLGAFLMLLRVREETPEELAGFVSACREKVPVNLQALEADFDLGCYAGKRRHQAWFVLAIFLLAQAVIVSSYTALMSQALIDFIWRRLYPISVFKPHKRLIKQTLKSSSLV